MKLTLLNGALSILLINAVQGLELRGDAPNQSIENSNINEDSHERLLDRLFPNRKNRDRKLFGNFISDSSKNCPNRIAINGTIPPNQITCTKCTNMQYCKVLDTFEIQEVYLPNNPELLGTCQVIDELGFRMSQTEFGVGTTFRDSPECKDMVLQYLCLYWGSDNDMYTNCCMYQEDVSSADPNNHLVAPRAPCRSFCVQVAQVCANDNKFVQLCEKILCPPPANAGCTPDPMVKGQTLGANIGCDLPFALDPYAPNAAAQLFGPSTIAVVVSLAAVLLTLFPMIYV